MSSCPASPHPTRRLGVAGGCSPLVPLSQVLFLLPGRRAERVERWMAHTVALPLELSLAVAVVDACPWPNESFFTRIIIPASSRVRLRAPAEMRKSAIRSCPLSAAVIKGVTPIWSRALTSASPSTSRVTERSEPAMLASASAVLPQDCCISVLAPRCTTPARGYRDRTAAPISRVHPASDRACQYHRPSAATGTALCRIEHLLRQSLIRQPCASGHLARNSTAGGHIRAFSWRAARCVTDGTVEYSALRSAVCIRLRNIWWKVAFLILPL